MTTIKELRRVIGLSQAELAEQVGSTQSAVSRLENGLGSPKRADGSWSPTATAVASAFGLTPEKIWPGAVPPTSSRKGAPRRPRGPRGFVWHFKSTPFADARIDAGMTVADVAEDAGVGQAVVSAFSTGRLSPISNRRNWRRQGKWTDMARRVARALGVAPEKLWPEAWAEVADEPIPEPPPKPDPVAKRAARVEGTQRLWADLPARTVSILALRKLGFPLAKIGEIHGVTRERVRQIEARTLVEANELLEAAKRAAIYDADLGE